MADDKQEESTSTSEDSPVKLSDSQRARIERNRQKALLLKQSRLSTRPYSLDKNDRDKNKVKLPPKLIDTGGGFLLEEEDEEDKQPQQEIVHPPGALIDPELMICQECEKVFIESYLLTKFDHPVCDECKDTSEKHALITKSDSKEKYLLTDGDLERREPPLKFIVKKNPHNPRWGDMKLYLDLHVKKRAMEVWGSEEKIEEDRERRRQNKEKTKQKKYDKKVKELRMAVRSSLWKKDLGPHEHVYGEETYNSESDEYSKTCTECGHVMSYEKM